MSIDSYRQTQTQSTVAALAEAAEIGGYAPSIHHTQPWRWRVDGDSLELYTEPTRQQPAADPGGRLMVLSCGAALHHARTALAAQGWRVEVDRMPIPSQSRLLARLRLTGRLGVTREAMRRLQTIRTRSAERPSGRDAPIAAGDIDAIRAVVEAEQARLHVLRPDDVVDLGMSLDRTQTLEEFDQEGATSAQPHRVSAESEPDAVYAILFGTDDTPSAWLHAGEALSAAELTAVERGVSVLPLSAPVEAEATQLTFVRLLAEPGQPFLVLRISHDGADLGRPPRRPTAQTVEVVGEPGPGRH